ncbi:MAG TPA: S41 family peptidase [Pseudobdellovibrionaceae bacterium]|nr:S41 family peptidase [Pseudobdellovibrionaceae bacterium]
MIHAFVRAVSPLALALVLVLASATTLTGCQYFSASSSEPQTLAESAALRPLSTSEAEADFNAMVEAIRSMYGPLEYKERRFGYKFDVEAQRLRSQIATTKTEEEKLAKFYELLRLFQDGHVYLAQPFRDDQQIPIQVTPVEQGFFIDGVHAELASFGIERGDELISVDGKSPEDLLKNILKYAWYGNDLSDRHLAYAIFYRAAHLIEMRPTQPFAQIEFKKPTGETRIARIAWRRAGLQRSTGLKPLAEAHPSDLSQLKGASLHSEPLAHLIQFRREVTVPKANAPSENSTPDASIFSMGNTEPYWYSRKLASQVGFTKVTADPALAAKYYALWRKQLEVFDSEPTPFTTPKTWPDVFAGLYKHNGKTVFMMRQPGYSAADFIANLSVYSALIEQFQPIADVLVIDQTENPGGSVLYVDWFARLFAPKGMNAWVQFNTADRQWISRWLGWLSDVPATQLTAPFAQQVRAYAASLDRDHDAGLRLAREPINFMLVTQQVPAPGAGVWKKPILITVDELCGSGGDAFPMLMKHNGLGKIFGRRTAGLGGSVEQVIELPHSRAKLSLTRGLFTTFRPDGQYPDHVFVENNGVTPDLEYTHTVQDFREGYKNYFEAFSKAATELVP